MSKRLVVLSLLAVMVFGGLSFGQADAGPGAYILSVDESACLLTVTFYADTAETYTIELYDDGDLVSYATVVAAAPGIYTADVLVATPIGQVAPGVGIYLDGPTSFDAIDPYYLAPDNICGAGEDMVPIPSYAVGGQINYTADVYWGPSEAQITKPLVVLEPGTTVWVLGPDETGEYYRILFAGDYLWVKSGTLGPNFDEVWQGTPLPSNVQS
ncbi:MAG: hypothetical protein GYB65_03670 [Chloroflexi bacterium]|nr:hypothetical protein [Chloroflexota bacterium]